MHCIKDLTPWLYPKCIYLISPVLIFEEAAFRMCSTKKLLWQVFQNSQENASTGVPFE